MPGIDEINDSMNSVSSVPKYNLHRRASSTFLSLLISAKVSPSNSNIGSHPRERIRIQRNSMRVRNKQVIPKAESPLSETIRPYYWNLERLPRQNGGDLVGTELTTSLPWKRTGSEPGPTEYPNVHTASAVLSSYGVSRLHKPSFPTASTKALLLNFKSVSLWLSKDWLHRFKTIEGREGKK